MSRIGNLEAKLQRCIEAYDKRFNQLECEHVHDGLFDPWSMSGLYHEICSKCGKVFRKGITEQECLELKLKAGKEKYASERKELEERLAVVKRENGKG